MNNIIFSKSKTPIPILKLYSCIKVNPISNSKRIIAFNNIKSMYIEELLNEISCEREWDNISRKSSLGRSLHDFLNYGLLMKIKMVKGGRVY